MSCRNERREPSPVHRKHLKLDFSIVFFFLLLSIRLKNCFLFVFGMVYSVCAQRTRYPISIYVDDGRHHMVNCWCTYGIHATTHVLHFKEIQPRRTKPTEICGISARVRFDSLCALHTLPKRRSLLRIVIIHSFDGQCIP